MSGCGTRFPRLVDRAFVRGLPARQRRQLREHIGTCPSCRERWEQLSIVDRRIGGPQLDDAVIEEIRRVVIPPPPRRRWWVAGAVGALASAALVLLVVRPDRSDPTFSPRGNLGKGRTPGVRVFCVAGDADHVRAEARMVSAEPPPELRCKIEDDLQLAYTTPDRKLTMVAFARSGSTMIQYAPRSNIDLAMPLVPNRIDELVGWSTSFSNHRPGAYELVVRFFDHDVTVREAIVRSVEPVAELRARLVIAGGDDAR